MHAINSLHAHFAHTHHCTCNLSSPASKAAISPSNLLTMKSKVVMPPPGSFGTPDLYSRRRWRRIQHIANEFWNWWRKEFLTSHQVQSKWSKLRHNLIVGDIVLLKTVVDDQNHWPMARVLSCETDNNGMVWVVKLRVGKSQILWRSVSEMVLLLENEMVQFPDEGGPYI